MSLCVFYNVCAAQNNCVSESTIVLLHCCLCFFIVMLYNRTLLTAFPVSLLQSMTLEEPVYIHPSSVLYHMNKEFIVYQSLEETSSRIYMKGNTA